MILLDTIHALIYYTKYRELSRKESQELLKKKQDRFSAFEKKANLREVMRDPLQRFKVFQHRNNKKKDPADPVNDTPIQNVVYKYEWDIKASVSQVSIDS